MGGPDMAPHTPQRSERPGEPVALLDHTACLAWGPRHGPHTPQRSERPGKPVALLDHTACLAWGPRHGPPYPPTLGAPRGTRGAPRSHRLLSMGAPTWPPIP